MAALGISQLAASERLTAWASKYVYAELHTGDPGANGTANQATETTRVAITWDAVDTSTPGVVTLTHTNDLDWSTVAASEDYSHVAVKSAISGGDFGGSGLITVDPVTIGDDFQLPAGSIIITQICAN